ncbi:MAG: EAL domain-containing protein [Acidobacteriota bacterium]|nr:EAL domain-containing protein [Acidobacteriota bacterium]
MKCSECSNGRALGFDFTMAFQPIVQLSTRDIYAYEALARGLNKEGAPTVFQKVDQSNLYRFDQTCRVKAIKLAAELGMSCRLSINFLPNAVYKPELCIRTTLNAAEQYGFPMERLIFEFSELEKIDDPDHVRRVASYYQALGFKTAVDDFGAGFSGLNFIAEHQTDIIKIDQHLIRNLHLDKSRRAIVKGIIQICTDLEITPIVEGVESPKEVEVLRDMGIDLFQGFYFARPAFESLTDPADIPFPD